VSLVVKDLIDAGVHFGHRSSRWNPKMKPYIYGKRNLIHIIDLKETVRGLLRAGKFFQRVASQNGLILFVGTKRQASETIVDECTRCAMPYVTERWLGGTLTNFRTIRSRLERLDELEQTLDGEQALSYSKKMIATLTRERTKIDRNLAGIRHMTRLPEALMVVDPHREHNAVAEARKLGIKVVALLDTDCDPDLVDLPIPGNDDSMRSIELVLRRLADSRTPRPAAATAAMTVVAAAAAAVEAAPAVPVPAAWPAPASAPRAGGPKQRPRLPPPPARPRARPTSPPRSPRRRPARRANPSPTRPATSRPRPEPRRGGPRRATTGVHPSRPTATSGRPLPSIPVT